MQSKSFQPTVIIDCTDENEQTKRMDFRNPVKVITTDRISEVRPSLREIQHAVDNGLYAAGYVSYEAAPAFDSAFRVHEDPKLPLLWFGLYEEPVSPERNVLNQVNRKQAYKCGQEQETAKSFSPKEGKHAAFSAKIHADRVENQASDSISGWQPTIKKKEYETAIESIHAAIAAGETYQVNYTMRFQAKFKGDARIFYEQLRQRQEAGYAAYLDIGLYQIVSVSPELFFRWDGEQMTMKPMKGTIGRGRWSEEDEAQREALLHSEKDRAENLMIVDLLRNDMGRISKTGRVKVPRLFDIERYPTIYQMTSTVEAETPAGTTLEDLFAALFPCGSITGAPKVSTMRIISELENAPREVYCGSVGYMAPGRKAVFNVAIRTAIINPSLQSAVYGSGGGITWDSTAAEEYEEALLKTKVLSDSLFDIDFELLETMRLEDGEIRLLKRHLERLVASAGYFRYPCDVEQVEDRLNRLAVSHRIGTWRLRLLLSRDGECLLDTVPIEPVSEEDGPTRFKLAVQPISKTDLFLYHKTTNRQVYELCKHAADDVFDVLLWNEEEEITEFTIGNIVIEYDGHKWTPPLECGLLAGTMRAELLAKGEIVEKKITKEELCQAERICLINSIRGWVPMAFVSN